jgi:hypothetical protein
MEITETAGKMFYPTNDLYKSSGTVFPKMRSASPCLCSLVRIIFVMVLSFSSNSSFCQKDQLSEIIITMAEELASDEPDTEAAGLYIDRLHELAEDPVQINSGDEDDISRLFFLTGFQIKTLTDYIRTTGSILTVYEIANIPGFDRETSEMMIPFITITDKPVQTSKHRFWNNSSLLNICYQPGEKDTSFSGPQYKLLNKYRLSAGGFSTGLTIEKDAGEKLISGKLPLPDFISAYFGYKGQGFIKKMIIGDFSAGFGFGTNINTGMRTSLPLTASGYIPGRNEVKPYTSTDENNFFRGIAMEFSRRNLSLTCFYSKNLIDATITNGADSMLSVQNLYTSGIHNKPSLLMKKDAVYDQTWGFNMTYNFNFLRVGLVWSEDRFSLPFEKSLSDLRSINDFEGKRNSLFTVCYSSLVGRILLHGEFSVNCSSSIAFVKGLSLRPSDRLIINCLIRDYEPGFTSFHGKGYGTSTSNWNERGITGNFTFEASKHFFVSAGCDFTSFPWLKYRCSAPSYSMREEIRMKFLPADNLSIETLYNFRHTMSDSPGITGIPDQNVNRLSHIRGSVRYSPVVNVTLGTRLDYKKAGSSSGMLLLQDISVRAVQIPLSIWVRYCLFNTQDWYSRIYTYENDLLYSFRIPALSGTGSRSYIMVKWEVAEFAEFRVKYGITSVSENHFIDHKEEIRIQARLFF